MGVNTRYVDVKLGCKSHNDGTGGLVNSQGGFDGRGKRSCKCNYVDFYKDARPPMLTFTKMPGPHADTAWAVVG